MIYMMYIRMKSIVVSDATYRVMRIFGKKYADVVRDAVQYFGVRRELFDSSVNRGQPVRTIHVHDDVHQALSLIKAELGFRTMDDAVFSVVSAYLSSKGVDRYCIERIVQVK
jgi:hypothetical protein